MQQVTTNELDSVEHHELLLVSIAGVSPAERGELRSNAIFSARTTGEGSAVVNAIGIVMQFYFH